MFRYATGWLGWSPVVALDATPVEIEQALEGWVACKRAQSPGPRDDVAEPEVVEPQDPAAFAAWCKANLMGGAKG